MMQCGEQSGMSPDSIPKPKENCHNDLGAYSTTQLSSEEKRMAE